MQSSPAPARVPGRRSGISRSPRACENCARTKLRCTRIEGISRCERCNRLDKECFPSIPRRVRRTTADLEKRLDGLISMFVANSGGADAAGVSSTLNVNLPQGTVNPNQNQDQNQGEGQDQIQDRTRESAPPQTVPVINITTQNRTPESAPPQTVPAITPTPIPTFMAPDIDITPEEADQCLNTFRTHMLKYFPFVHIPHGMTARKLYERRPFLWYCIVAISCKSTAKQVALLKTVRQSIAQGIVLDHNRNIDLLLGLLVFIGWLNFQVHSRPFATLYIQLALGIVYDLGLNKNVPKESPVSQPLAAPGERPRPVRTMEERRAVLGCYYITSVMSLYMQKPPALDWTPHLDECLQVLAAEKGCPNDEVLVQIVRSQLIAERASQVPQSERENAEIPFCIKALMSQLDDFKRQIPAELQNNEVVQLHTHYAVHVVHELALYSRGPMAPISSTGAFHRIHHLYTCLHAVKSSFDLILSFPPSSYLGFPSSSMFPKMTHGLATLFKLATLNEPGWDKALARSTADPLQILDRFIERTEMASRECGLINNHPVGDMLTRALKVTRRMRQFWEAKMVAGVVSVSAAGRNPDGGSGSGLLEGVMDYQAVPDTFSMDWFDAGWMSEFLGSVNS